jgi:hypothetical protein
VRPVVDRDLAHAECDRRERQRVTAEAVGQRQCEGRADEAEHAERRQPVGDAARIEQVAVELVRARSKHGGVDARKVEMERVVDDDRAGGEAEQPRAAVAPGLRTGPGEDFDDVELAARTERIEAAVAQPGAADVHLDVVVVGTGGLETAPRRVRAELHDRRPGGELAADQRSAAAHLDLQRHAVGHRHPYVARDLWLLGGCVRCCGGSSGQRQRGDQDHGGPTAKPGHVHPFAVIGRGSCTVS